MSPALATKRILHPRPRSCLELQGSLLPSARASDAVYTKPEEGVRRFQQLQNAFQDPKHQAAFLTTQTPKAGGGGIKPEMRC